MLRCDLVNLSINGVEGCYGQSARIIEMLAEYREHQMVGFDADDFNDEDVERLAATQEDLKFFLHYPGCDLSEESLRLLRNNGTKILDL